MTIWPGVTDLTTSRPTEGAGVSEGVPRASARELLGWKEGETLNINADLVAGKIASALRAEKLMLLTDVAGILDAEGELISSIDAAEAPGLIAAGVVRGGMIPKVNCALDALTSGVNKVHIIDGRTEHAVLLEVFTSGGIGTQLLESTP